MMPPSKRKQAPTPQPQRGTGQPHDNAAPFEPAKKTQVMSDPSRSRVTEGLEYCNKDTKGTGKN